MICELGGHKSHFDLKQVLSEPIIEQACLPLEKHHHCGECEHVEGKLEAKEVKLLGFIVVHVGVLNHHQECYETPCTLGMTYNTAQAPE